MNYVLNAVDSVRMKLASTFVHAFVNAGHCKHKLVLIAEDPSTTSGEFSQGLAQLTDFNQSSTAFTNVETAAIVGPGLAYKGAPRSDVKELLSILRSMRTLWFMVVALLFSAVTNSTTDAATLPESEYLALYDLYNSTSGVDWIYPDGAVQWVFAGDADPCGDAWQGVTCFINDSPVPNTYHVYALILPEMDLRGPLPTTLDSLPYLLFFDLDTNQLTGRIPDSVGNMVDLIGLALQNNQLTGPIPTSIGDLLNLQYMFLSDNHLTGPILSSIGSLTNLQYVLLSDNQLAGRIPESIGSLTSLIYMNLNTNALTGSIPNSIASLVNLQYLYLNSNDLSGPIPDSIGNLVNLLLLDLDTNQLTSTIPHSIGGLATLQKLYLDTNQLAGSIPDSIGNAVELQDLALLNNLLTGPIPDSIGNLVNLTDLYLSKNQLTGPIPDSIGSLVKLTDMLLNKNQLFGRIPDSIGSLINLQYLNLNYNKLTGSIPDSIGNFLDLCSLYLNNNLLVGCIPSTFGSAGTVLQALDLSNNALTGTVPVTIANMVGLLSIALQGNKLSGPLTDRFSAAQVALLTIRLDYNQFTGALPSVLFALPSLRSLSIVDSCLHGTLPDNICNATQLEALVLYGLTTGESCRDRGVQSLSEPLSSTQHTFGGAFPSCLLQLPNLATLLLSSNRLTGSISSSTMVGAQFSELDLSHNVIDGTIPLSLQNHSWSMFDLSYNKFAGVLQTDMFQQGNRTLLVDGVYSPVISLTGNRLSGPVPSSLMPVQSNLSVLAGNLFECKYDKSNLPQHDSDISNYQCASNSFNISIYVWLGLVVVAIVLLLGVYRQFAASLLVSFIQLSDQHSTKLTHLFALLEEFHTLQKAGWCCAAFCMLVLLPYYALMSHYEGIHTHQYAYVLSAIYVSGVAPFVVDALLWAVLLVAVYCGGQVFMRGKFAVRRVQANQVTWKRAYVWAAFAFVSVVTVLGTNVAFVYVVLYQNSKWQTPAQILLSLSKLAWSMVASPALLRRLKLSYRPADDVNESYFTLQLLVALLSNIAIPCLVVAAIDTNCFSNILLPPESQTVEYLLPVCVDDVASGEVCEEIVSKPITLQFTPPFTYGYQCSASFITAYAPTFIYMSMSTVFLSPLLQYVLLRLHKRLPAGSTVHKLVSLVLPRILKPLNDDGIQMTVRHQAPLFGGVDCLVSLLTQLGILLTFGAIFPPIALAMAVSITAVVVVTRYKLLRFVRAVVEKRMFAYLDIINMECERVGTREQMQFAATIIICYCCAFYAMFLFDTLGDAVGFDASVWVLIVIPLLPIAAFGGANVHRRYQSRLVPEHRLKNPKEPEALELSVHPAGMLDAVSSHGEYVSGEEAGAAGTVNALHTSHV